MWPQFLSLIAIGASVGWLAGLSVSPVAGTVIGGLLGLVGGLGAGAMLWGPDRVLAALRDRGATAAEPAARPIDLRPAAVLALAVAAAVPLGIIARTHQWFAAPGGVAATTTTTTTTAAGRAADATTAPVLFADRLGDCAELVAASRGHDDVRFRALVREASPLGARLERELSLDSLRVTVRALCAA